jgi:hypothetical protein
LSSERNDISHSLRRELDEGAKLETLKSRLVEAKNLGTDVLFEEETQALYATYAFMRRRYKRWRGRRKVSIWDKLYNKGAWIL